MYQHKWDVYAASKGDLAADTESITHCFMKLNFKLIQLIQRYIFRSPCKNKKTHFILQPKCLSLSDRKQKYHYWKQTTCEVLMIKRDPYPLYLNPWEMV